MPALFDHRDRLEHLRGNKNHGRPHRWNKRYEPGGQDQRERVERERVIVIVIRVADSRSGSRVRSVEMRVNRAAMIVLVDVLKRRYFKTK